MVERIWPARRREYATRRRGGHRSVRRRRAAANRSLDGGTGPARSPGRRRPATGGVARWAGGERPRRNSPAPAPSGPGVSPVSGDAENQSPLLAGLGLVDLNSEKRGLPPGGMGAGAGMGGFNGTLGPAFFWNQRAEAWPALFLELLPVAATPREPGPPWPAEARALARRLLRADVLGGVAGGLRIENRRAVLRRPLRRRAVPGAGHGLALPRGLARSHQARHEELVLLGAVRVLPLPLCFRGQGSGDRR